MAAKSPTGKISIVLRPISHTQVRVWVSVSQWGSVGPTHRQHPSLNVALIASFHMSRLQTISTSPLLLCPPNLQPWTNPLIQSFLMMSFPVRRITASSVLPSPAVPPVFSSVSRFASYGACLVLPTILYIFFFYLTDTLLSQITPGTYYVPPTYVHSIFSTHSPLIQLIIIYPFSLTTFPCSLIPHLLILMLVYFLHLSGCLSYLFPELHTALPFLRLPFDPFLCLYDLS